MVQLYAPEGTQEECSPLLYPVDVTCNAENMPTLKRSNHRARRVPQGVAVLAALVRALRETPFAQLFYADLVSALFKSKMPVFLRVRPLLLLSLRMSHKHRQRLQGYTA